MDDEDVLIVLCQNIEVSAFYTSTVPIVSGLSDSDVLPPL